MGDPRRSHLRASWSSMTRAATGWLGLAWLAFAVLPWYALPGDGWVDLGWLRRFPDAATAPALVQGLLHGRPWLLPAALPLLLPFLAWRRPKEDPRVATLLVAAGAGGFAWTALQGLAIGHRGWSTTWLANLLGGPGPRQTGFGTGALLFSLACLVLLCHGLAARGFMKGDAFLASAIGLVVALVTVFVFWPVVTVLASAVRDESGALAPSVFLDEAHGPLDLGAGLSPRSSPVRRGVEHAVPRDPGGGRHDDPRPGLRSDRHPHRVSGEAAPARPVRAPDHHAAVRHRSRADPPLRPFGGRHHAAADWFGIPRTRWLYGLARRPDRPAPRLRADRVPRPDRRRAGNQPVARGGGTDAPGEPLDDVPDGDLAAPPARGRQRVPARVRGEHGRLRQSPGPVGELRGPVHPDLLRGGGGGARPGSGRRARPGAARLHAGGVLRAAAVAGAAGLHHRDREGGRGAAGAAPGSSPMVLLRARAALGRAGDRDLRRHHRGRVRAGHGPGLHADAPALPDGLRRRARGGGRPPFHGVGLGLLLDHDPGRRDRGADHRRDRAC